MPIPLQLLGLKLVRITLLSMFARLPLVLLHVRLLEPLRIWILLLLHVLIPLMVNLHLNRPPRTNEAAVAADEHVHITHAPIATLFCLQPKVPHHCHGRTALRPLVSRHISIVVGPPMG